MLLLLSVIKGAWWLNREREEAPIYEPHGEFKVASFQLSMYTALWWFNGVV